MPKPYVTLKPTEQTIVTAAATIYAGYVSAGKVADGSEKDWLRRSLKEAIARYTDWLQDNDRSPRYIQEIRWVLEKLRGHIGDHLTVAQHTTFLVVGALKKCRSTGTKKIRYQSFYSWLYDQKLRK